MENEKTNINYFVKSTAEFEMFETFKPITGLSAFKAAKKYAELQEKNIDCGIGINIKGDRYFDDPQAKGVTVLIRHNGKDTFNIYGDTFIKYLKDADDHSRNLLTAYKELDKAGKDVGLVIEDAPYITQKENELFGKNKEKKEEDAFYSSVAYLQFPNETAIFNELDGNEKAILTTASQYDYKDGINLEYTYKNAKQNFGDFLLCEDKNYAVVTNNVRGGTYEIFAKVSPEEILKSYEHDPTQKISKDVKELVENYEDKTNNQQQNFYKKEVFDEEESERTERDEKKRTILLDKDIKENEKNLVLEISKFRPNTIYIERNVKIDSRTTLVKIGEIYADENGEPKIVASAGDFYNWKDTKEKLKEYYTSIYSPSGSKVSALGNKQNKITNLENQKEFLKASSENFANSCEKISQNSPELRKAALNEKLTKDLTSEQLKSIVNNATKQAQAESINKNVNNNTDDYKTGKGR